MAVSIGSLMIKNPVMTASGTFGYGQEFEDFVDLSHIGAIVVKGISLEARPGNPPPRVVETSCGMLNSIGLENVGIKKFIQEKMVFLRKYRTKVIVNILGDTIDDYCSLCEQLHDVDGVAAIEVNISCPNVKQGGVAFGTDAGMVNKVTMAVRKQTNLPIIIKLSPNVTDIAMMAKAAEEGGADAISLINTLLGMAIDIKKKTPKLANIVGGLSGPAIKPVALRMVWQTAKTVKIPVIGIGGIGSTEDAVEFMLAGATAVQVGTANFINPSITTEIISGLEMYRKENNHATIREITGALKLPTA